MQTWKVKLKSRENIVDDVIHLVFDWVNEPRSFKAGQYFMFRMQIEDGKFINKAYSIASSQNRNYLEFCVKVLPGGFGSTKLNTILIGEEMEVVGPMGHMSIDRIEEDKDIVLVCAGTGIAPFKSMVESLLENGFKKKIWLLNGFRTKNTILYKELFEEIALKHSNFIFVPVISREQWGGKMGHAQDHIKNYVKDPKKTYAFICGLPKMVEETRNILDELGFDGTKIFQEKYG